jgi:pimeloyl-ACP methyl ester carboxylesterase
MAIAHPPGEPGDWTSAKAGRALRVNDPDVYGEVVGAGPDVLMPHCLPDSHARWRNQVAALVKAGFRVIVPHLRGYKREPARPRRTLIRPKRDDFHWQ